jgi:hypothetical protein
MVAAETMPPLMTTSALPDVSVYAPEDVLDETVVVVMEAPALADCVRIASQTGLYFIATGTPLPLDDIIAKDIGSDFRKRCMEVKGCGLGVASTNPSFLWIGRTQSTRTLQNASDPARSPGYCSEQDIAQRE